jgi:aspartate aminotransferase-like enzyme
VSDAPELERMFLPGPVAVAPEVLAAMLQPMVSHRTPQMSARLAAMQPMLQALFRTTQPVLLVTASATGLMEAAVRSLRPAPVLCVVGGYFSERFAKIAEACGRTVIRLRVPFDRPVTAQDLDEALQAHPYVGAVTMVHSETGSGVLLPLAELVATIRARSDALILVDAVTSLAGSPVETDALALDVVFTGSQKAMGLPPGLAFGVVSEKYLAQARHLPGRGFYLDLVSLHESAQRSLFPQTPALPIVFALEHQLRRIGAEGVEARWARHARMRGLVDGWSARTGVAILAPVGARSHTVSALRVADGQAEAVAHAMAARGYVLTIGLPPYDGDFIRLGHMGDVQPGAVEGVLEVLGEVIGTP